MSSKPRFTVTNSTTLEALDEWMALRPNIDAARLRRPKGDPVDPPRGYRAIFEFTNETPVMGESKPSLVEALDSAVAHVEELFPL